jgi:hypothetical protein
MKLFTDNVPTLVIQASIVRGMHNILCPTNVFAMDPELVAKIAGESEDKVLEREELLRKLATLEAGSRICNQYALRQTGKFPIDHYQHLYANISAPAPIVESVPNSQAQKQSAGVDFGPVDVGSSSPLFPLGPQHGPTATDDKPFQKFKDQAVDPTKQPPSLFKAATSSEASKAPIATSGPASDPPDGSIFGKPATSPRPSAFGLSNPFGAGFGSATPARTSAFGSAPIRIGGSVSATPAPTSAFGSASNLSGGFGSATPAQKLIFGSASNLSGGFGATTPAQKPTFGSASNLSGGFGAATPAQKSVFGPPPFNLTGFGSHATSSEASKAPKDAFATLSGSSSISSEETASATSR